MKNRDGRPNILFLMTDQQRWDALGCVNPIVRTPNLDALAARGIRFSQAICNVPMCVPSRYSMMLGLYPSQSGVRHNTNMCETDDRLPLPVLPQRLHELGYQTAGFGKTHWFVGSDLAPDVPVRTSRRGFEIRAQARGTDPKEMEPGATVMKRDASEAFAALEEETRPFGGGGEGILGYTGCTSEVSAAQHRESWLTQKALDFLEDNRDPHRPFFLYLSFDFPHPGFNVPLGYEGLYDIEDIPERPRPPWQEHCSGHAVFTRFPEEWEQETSLQRRRTTLRYYALCSYVDELFGRVIARLDDMGELDDTFVIFLSDHGEMLGDRFHRFSKYCLYEGSIRVPMIVAGVGVPGERKGTVDDRHAELVDVLPTLLHVARADVPPELPGLNLLSGTQRCGGFAEMHGGGYEGLFEGSSQRAPTYMWRTRNWKLIVHLPGEVADAFLRLDEVKGELYDLQHDPHEWINRYDDPHCLAVRERMTRNLLMHLACAWGRYPRQAGQTDLG